MLLKGGRASLHSIARIYNDTTRRRMSAKGRGRPRDFPARLLLSSTHNLDTTVSPSDRLSNYQANRLSPTVLVSSIKSSSSRLVASHLLRTLSTSAPTASSAAQQAVPTENSHERQSKQRKPQLSKVREDGGETASLLAQAVSSTVQHRGSLPTSSNGGFNRHRRPQQQQQQQQQGERQPRRQQQESAEGGAEGARIRSRPGQLGGQLVSRRKAAGGLYDADASAISAPIAGSEVASSPRANSNPRQQNRRGGENFRASNPSTSNARRPPTSSAPRPPRKPRAQNKAADLGAPVLPATPPPSKVHYPSLDLASLIEQDLRNNAAALRAEIGHGAEAEEGDQKARLEARKEVRGDYSRWTAGEGKGKHEVVQRAAGVLASNPSVSREGRDFLVDQLQGLLTAKKK